MINEQYASILGDETRAKEVAQTILTEGYIILKDFLKPEVFAKLQALMEDRSNGNKKGEQLKGTIGYELGFSDDIFNFSQQVHKARCDIEGKECVPLDRSKQAIGFPYKDARGGKPTKPTHYHFDGAYINILIPIVLPADQQKSGGRLILFPNIRKKYGVFLAKFICRFLRHFVWFRKLWGFQTVQYEVGSCYIFFGDISFHGVDPITSDERIVMTINSHW